MLFSQPGRKFSAKGLSIFAFSATKNWRTNPVKKLSNYSSDDVETIFDNFSEIFYQSLQKAFQKCVKKLNKKKSGTKSSDIWRDSEQVKCILDNPAEKCFSAVVPKSLSIYSLFKEKSLETLCHVHRGFINRDGNLLVKN